MSRSNYDIGDTVIVKDKRFGKILQVKRCPVLHRTEYLVKHAEGEEPVWVNHFEVKSYGTEEETV